MEFGPRSVSFVAAVPQPGGDGVVHTYRLKLEPLSHEIARSSQAASDQQIYS